MNMHTHQRNGRCSLLVPIREATVRSIKLRILITKRPIGVFSLSSLYSNSHLLSKLFFRDCIFKYCDMPGWVSLLFTDSFNSTIIYLVFAVHAAQIAGSSDCRLCNLKQSTALKKRKRKEANDPLWLNHAFWCSSLF
ncbi:hypothetical protein J4Q44_G00123960 [Coregonus suidteri]|uniref:Uncharacterized protein n=1 Tax=Coregonus suidteri TaxID=861788 RepID=A0AAN8MGR1_9TELE